MSLSSLSISSKSFLASSCKSDNRFLVSSTFERSTLALAFAKRSATCCSRLVNPTGVDGRSIFVSNPVNMTCNLLTSDCRVGSRLPMAAKSVFILAIRSLFERGGGGVAQNTPATS